MAVSFRGPRSPGPYVWDIICVSLLLSMSLVSSTVFRWVALEIDMYNITTFDTIFAYLAPFAPPPLQDVCLACSPHIRGTVILCPVYPAHFLFGHQWFGAGGRDAVCETIKSFIRFLAWRVRR
ncbi:hypothetical protein C8F04DRAFT_1122206 [Mycena alexandri]|uniref:Uncharacterized protein n=1 Tax=Mycena alexandri TaxID=1745969 RepID=A0AAD6SHA9_9AGAR|nr:hypothetical protein C8F04DRAFT_1122206 [Mycena alexandri]